MKRATFVAVLLASGVLLTGALASAQSSVSTPGQAASSNQIPLAPDPAPAFFTGAVNFALQSTSDVASSKFQEYRDMPNGAAGPSFRLSGNRSGVRFDLRGDALRQADQQYAGSVKTGMVAITGEYNGIVHRLGNAGRTLLSEQSPGVWRISPIAQSAVQQAWESTPTASRFYDSFFRPLFGNAIAEGNVVDVSVQRQRSHVVVDAARNRPFTVQVRYGREQRHGSGGLSANYLTAVTETPSVTEYLTQDLEATAMLTKPWGNVRAGLGYNRFDDHVPALLFDSPFRGSDAVSTTVGAGALATSVGGPSSGLVVNPPDNEAYTGTFGMLVKLPSHTRLTANGSLAELTQNAQFYPFITNTAVVTPLAASSTASLPAQSLNGKIRTTSLAVALASRPIDPLQLAVRYRYYDSNNRTSPIAFTSGMGNWDRTFTAAGASGPRVTVPYSHAAGRFEASAGYTTHAVTFEGGFRRATIDRTFRETEQTAENTGSAAAVVQIAGAAKVRAKYELASRGYTGLDLARSENASFVVTPAGLPSNLLAREGNLRFDQARRRSNRAGVDLDLSAGEATTFTVSYLRHHDTYKGTEHGLTADNYDTITGEVSIAPGESWNLFAFYSYEKNGNNQLNNGVETGSVFLPLNDLPIALEDKVNSVGAGIAFHATAKAIVNLNGQYQQADGNAGFTAQAGSAHQLARASLGGVKDIPNLDDTKMSHVEASVDYTLAQAWTVTVGAMFEDYTANDIATTDLLNAYGGTSVLGTPSGASALFLAPNDGSYHARVAYVRLNYRW